MALSKFSLQYVPQKTVKGQALVDFLAQHPPPYELRGNDVKIGTVQSCDNHWMMYFDRSNTATGLC